jgi:hypothetical protein
MKNETPFSTLFYSLLIVFFVEIWYHCHLTFLFLDSRIANCNSNWMKADTRSLVLHTLKKIPIDSLRLRLFCFLSLQILSLNKRLNIRKYNFFEYEMWSLFFNRNGCYWLTFVSLKRYIVCSPTVRYFDVILLLLRGKSIN